MTKINLRLTAKPHEHLWTLTKTNVKFQRDSGEIVGGVAFTIYRVHMLWLKFKQKMTKSKLRKKIAEINDTITAKRHAHRQPLTKTSAKD